MSEFRPEWQRVGTVGFLLAAWVLLMLVVRNAFWRRRPAGDAASGPGAGPQGAWARRACLALAGLLGAASIVLALWYGRERALVSAFTDAADREPALAALPRLERYVRYADEGVSLAAARARGAQAVRLYYELNPLHPGPGDVVRWGPDYRGPCGSLSRVVHAMLDARGIRNRFLFLTDDHGQSLHTVLEIFDRGKWAVVDPSYGIVYRHPDGTLVTVAELRADTALFHRHVGRVAAYDPRYDYHATTHLNWNKVPVLLPAVRQLLVWVLGEARVGEMGRPSLWIWPRLLASVACGLTALVLAAIGLGLAPGRAGQGRAPREPVTGAHP